MLRYDTLSNNPGCEEQARRGTLGRMFLEGEKNPRYLRVVYGFEGGVGIKAILMLLGYSSQTREGIWEKKKCWERQCGACSP